jgi:Protein of unknown function (DUF2778)
LIHSGVRGVPLGIAAMFLTFILKSAGTQAGPADIGSLAPGISVFGTIHPDIFRMRAPLGSEPPPDRLQVASLQPLIGLAAAADRFEVLTDALDLACRNASSGGRIAEGDDCPASFAERFSSTMPVLASSLRSPPNRDDNSQSDVPKPIVISRLHVPAGQASKEIPLPGDDGRTAIYDITAHTVYLPNGHRLEAHSGLGSLMDSPRHVHLKMRGATPPNVYNLALRERIFHGVRAIRLNPVDDGRMHGRDGILAHSYMLGSNGQSNGCVAFRTYPEFLDAFLKGEVTRLAVVDRLENPPGTLAVGQLPEPVRELMKATDRTRQYAAAGTSAGEPVTPQKSR